MTDLHPDERLDVVLDRLEGVRRNGDGFVARCPAHPDRNPSLSVKIGKRWIVFKCHAGCSNDAVRVALDLDWKDLVLDDRPAGERKPRRRDWRAIELEARACSLRLQNEPDVLPRFRFKRGWAAGALELLEVGWDGSRLTLPVYDKEGKLHDVLRYDPFATGRKVLAGRGKSRLPFPAPERIDTADVLFIVEGEGTAISMFSVGLYAVALPGSIARPTHSVERPGSWQGAGWHKRWAERFLRFRHLILLPDCDGPGRALMGAVRYDLERAGHPSVRIVDLGPKSWDGQDVADMLLRGTYDSPTRRIARDVLRTIVAEEAEILVA